MSKKTICVIQQVNNSFYVEVEETDDCLEMYAAAEAEIERAAAEMTVGPNPYFVDCIGAEYVDWDVVED